MQMFFQLQKVDAKTGLVSGRAVEEVVDHAGEIFDYAKSKPHFEAWSTGIAKATDGKSAGNVRAMHGKVSAGILKDIVFNDAEKAIDITALINDPVEKSKLLAGNYTGFSIGGSYVGEKWEDTTHKGVMRYEAQPSEISIVDLPCVPTAMFTAIKADGSQELRKFHVPTNTEKLVDAIEKTGDVVAESLSKSAAAVEDGATHKPTPTDPAAAAASTEKAIEPKLQKRAEFLAKHEPAHRLIDTVRAAYGKPTVEKGMYDVADLASLISNLMWIVECAEGEAIWEGDNSAVPAELRASLKQLGAILIDMAREEVAEIVGDDVIELSAKVTDLAKSEPNDATRKVLGEMHAALAAFAAPVEKTAEAPLSKVHKAVLDETTHALEKARTENKGLVEKVATLEKEVTELKKLPAAKGPVLRVVGKGADAVTVEGEAEEVAPVKGADGKIDEVATKLKKIRFGGVSK